MAETYKVVGITTHGDVTKVRFTDDLVRRNKQFNKGGATRVQFVELLSAMTKVDALKHMLTMPEFQSPSDQATIADALADREKKVTVAGVTVKVAKTPAKGKVAAKTSAKTPAKGKVAAKTSTKTSGKKATKEAAVPSIANLKARAKKVTKPAVAATATDATETTEPVAA